MLESAYQRKVIERWEKLGFYVIKLAKTNKNGIPDLLWMKPGEIIFVEVKAVNGKLSALQKYRISELELKGFKVIVDEMDNHTSK